MRLPHMSRPCKDCPFRTDSAEGWLGEKRMESILNSESFVCHKNTHLQCAGHMIISADNNSFVRLAERMHIPLVLGGHELVFKSKEECINHHAN